MRIQLLEDTQDSFAICDCITHGGFFHADDAMASEILRRYYEKVFPEKESLKIVRTLDRKKAEKLEMLKEDYPIIYDIGRGRYDHHQENRLIRKSFIPYASAGLLWKKFGMAICENDVIFDYVDKNLIEGIDAIDNGIKSPQSSFVSVMSISRFISSLNPVWYEDSNFDLGFLTSCDICKLALDRAITTAKSNILAESTVLRAMSEATGEILLLNQYVPWQDTLLKFDKEKRFKYVVFEGIDKSWKCQAVPISVGSFINRKSLPTNWHSLNGSKFVKITNVEDAIYCHHSGYICSATTKEGAIKLANLALEE